MVPHASVTPAEMAAENIFDFEVTELLIFEKYFNFMSCAHIKLEIWTYGPVFPIEAPIFITSLFIT